MTVVLLEAANFGLRHLVEAAVDRGHRVILFTGDRSRYAYELSGEPPGSLEIVDLDTNDVDLMVEHLQGVTDLAGVIRMTDRWSLQALAVAQRLGLPHENPDAVALLRDKARLRQHLYETGFSVGTSVVIDPHAVVPPELVEKLPFPGIVKDRVGDSSENVWLVRDQDELAQVLGAARKSERLRGGRVTVEPYFVGPMYSAETVSWDGELAVVGLSSRIVSPLPYFREEGGSFPVALPEATWAQVTRWLSGILDSVGYRDGLTHTEFIMTARGPEIVEINTRLGGVLVGEVIRRSLGVDIHGAVVDLALGRRPRLMDLVPEREQGTALVAVYAPAAGEFTGIDGVGQLAGQPGSPTLYPVCEPGDVITATVDQRGLLAALLADGDTAELALHNALSAARGLTVRMR